MNRVITADAIPIGDIVVVELAAECDGVERVTTLNDIFAGRPRALSRSVSARAVVRCRTLGPAQ